MNLTELFLYDVGSVLGGGGFAIFLGVYIFIKLLYSKSDKIIRGLTLLDAFMLFFIGGMIINSFPLEAYKFGYTSHEYEVTLIILALWLGFRANFKELLSRLRFDLNKLKGAKKNTPENKPDGKGAFNGGRE